MSGDTIFKQDGITIAGGNGRGNQLDQLNFPWSVHVDDNNQRIYIAESENHRVVEWKYGAKSGQVVAGGNGGGTRMDQLYRPAYVTVDQMNDCLIISDYGNRRVVRWSRQNNTNQEIIISDIDCLGLTLDNNGNLYVCDYKKNEVRRWTARDEKGTIVAGGNGNGNQLNQLNGPSHIFVDRDNSMYISDCYNYRVMKWMKGAKEGIVVASGHGPGNSLRQLSNPRGVLVDQWENIYVVDWWDHRVVRWLKGSKEGSILIGNVCGNQSNQLNNPIDISFDGQGNLYVTDNENHRVQKFVVN